MAKKATISMLMTLFAFLAIAQSQGGGLIEGDKWAFLISAPMGWIWDSKSLHWQGVSGLFYKAGDTYSPTKLHIYVCPSPKKADGPATLEEFIETDQATFMKPNPGTLVKDLEPFSPGMEYSFVQKDFDDSNENYYQSIAYYEGKDAYFVFVLSSRSAEERDRERTAFHELLASFTYISKGK